MSRILLLQMYSNQQVFISHAGPQKHFALHLRTQLRHAGVSTFVDVRELQPGQQDPAGDIMKTACEQAEAAIFVITRDFLRRPATIDELRWVLAQHDPQRQGPAANKKPPQLLTVLYPTSVLRSWRKPAELQQMLSGSAAAPQLPEYAVQLVEQALNDTPVGVDELRRGKLAKLLHMYHPEAKAHQAIIDLKSLARLSVFRLDSVARYDALLLSRWQRVNSGSDQIVVGHGSEPVNLQHVLCSAISSTCTACRGDDLLVEKVRKAVLGLQFSVQHSGEQLVGLAPQLQTIRTALAPGQGVRLHGLCGLGGIGKSTLAQQYFQEARSQFTRHAFVHVGQHAALPDKQRELLQQINGDPAKGSGDAGLCAALCNSFKGGPLLLVLDDLWEAHQLAALLGCQPDNKFQLPEGLLGPGSRVLITARGKAVVKDRIAGAAAPQQVQPLPELAAQQLLCLHAFHKGVQPLSISQQNVADATSICGGLPLTLRLLGGSLRRYTTPAGWQVMAFLPAEQLVVFTA